MGSVLADVQSPLQILNVQLIRGSEDAASDNATCTNNSFGRGILPRQAPILWEAF